MFFKYQSATCLGGSRLAAAGVTLPPLGFGAATLGNLYAVVSDEQAEGAIAAALAGGIRYFDTAPYYGFGLSETRLGATLSREQILVSSKVGRVLEPFAGAPSGERHGFVNAAPFTPVFDYSYDGVMRSFESSCQRLGRRRIDVLFAHDLGQLTHGDDHPRQFRTFMEGGYLAMRELVEAGQVGAIGLGVNETAVCEQALAHADFDVIMLAGRYTLLEQDALDTFMPLCERRGVSVVVAGPFNSGILVGSARTGGKPHYDYDAPPPAVVEKVARLEAACASYGAPLAAAALQFPLAHPAVVNVVPGMKTAAHVARALDWTSHEIPSDLWNTLRESGLVRADAPLPGLASGA